MSGRRSGDSESPPFERLEERNPVDTGAFHGHRLDVVFFEPGGNRVQVGSVIATGAHQLGVLVARHADHDFVRAEVYSGGVRVDPAHRRERPGFRQTDVGLAEFAHRVTPGLDWAGPAASVE